MEITAEVRQMIESKDLELTMLAVSLLIHKMNSIEDYRFLKHTIYKGNINRDSPGFKMLRKRIQKKHLENIKNRINIPGKRYLVDKYKIFINNKTKNNGTQK